MSFFDEQYRHIENILELRRTDAAAIALVRREEILNSIPEYAEACDQIREVAGKVFLESLKNNREAIEKLKLEGEKLEKKKATLLAANGYPENYLEDVYHCPLCKDTGYLSDGKRCSCFNNLIADMRNSKSSGIMDLIFASSFEDFSLDYYQNRQGMSDVLSAAIKYTEEFDIRDGRHRNLVFYGPSGLGKSFLSYCIAHRLIETSHYVLYFTACELFDLFAKHAFGNAGLSEAEESFSLREITDCDLLIIDDLGSEVTNAFTSSKLFDCLNERELKGKPILISTNLSLGDFKEKYSERIFSRYVGNFTFYKFEGTDIRMQKRS